MFLTAFIFLKPGCLKILPVKTTLVEYFFFPRIFALSEVVWSKNKPSFEVFEKKVIDFYPILNDMDINYSNHLERLEE